MTYSLRSGLKALGGLVVLCGAVLAIVGPLGSTQGCVACDCATAGAKVAVPPGRAADIAQVAATGAMCTATIQCETGDAPCTLFLIEAQRAGVCHVQVTFTSGAAPLTRDVEFQPFNNCCGTGFEPPAGQDLIQVPAATAMDASAG